MIQLENTISMKYIINKTLIINFNSMNYDSIQWRNKNFFYMDAFNIYVPFLVALNK